MASDDGENTSFPCLATVRSLLAGVVTVLAVVVVVMVIVVVHRPEDISLSIGGGYLQTDQVWWKEFVSEEQVLGSAKTTQIDHDPQVGVNVGGGGGLLNVGVLLSDIGHADLPPPETQVGLIDPDIGVDPGVVNHEPGRASRGHKQTQHVVSVRRYERATDPVILQVTWSAHNPSGRGPVSCNVTDIRVHDMPAGASSAGRELGRGFSVQDPLRFHVPPQSSHTERQLLNISDKDTLKYLFDNYKLKNSFRAMVRVSTTITSKAQLSWATGKNVDHCCGPVVVVYGTPDDGAYGPVTCNMQSSATPSFCESSAPTPHSQPPAPAPTGG